MKNIYKYISIAVLTLTTFQLSTSQITLGGGPLVPVTDSVCRGEQVCVYIPSSPRGTISYESSLNLATWTPMSGSNDSLCFTMPTTNIYVRAILTEGTCDPVITDTLLFVNKKYQRQVTFNFTSSIQTFTIPNDVCDSIFVELWGAQGGSGATGGSSSLGGVGGLGGYISGYIAVTPGDVLNLFVGGQGATPTGGFNGGANGGSTNAGGGGGATDIRIGGTSEADRVIAAGGGGGGGRGGCDNVMVEGGDGGQGGGGVGENGVDSPTPFSAPTGVAGGGRGGNFGSIQGAFGPAGAGCAGFLGSPGIAATTGTGGTGGAGQSCCCFGSYSVPGGGGGGGGMLGGGGGGGGSAGTTSCSGNDKGAGGGGGGGSSAATPSVTGVVTNPGIWLGNGQIIISY